mmetsp:Transcript_3988/g.13156  ORF Transcript_3988/g.13156 Transcript_3988/m.13156 type:complete len:542 (-) Transcript_3988:135-1760(-)
MGSGGGGACDCCGTKSTDERIQAPATTSAPSSSRSIGVSLTSLKSFDKKGTGARSLRSLTMRDGDGGAREEPREAGEARVEDDPATHYSDTKKPRDRAAAMGGMYIQPHYDEKFDSQRFKRRVGDHLAAQAAMIAKESAPLLSGADVGGGYAASDDAVKVKREAKRKKKELESNEKEDRRELKYAAQRQREHQKQMWRALVTIMLVVVVLAGIIFSGDVDFKFGFNTKKGDGGKISDVVRARARDDDSTLLAMTEPATGGYSASETRDEDVDLLDPTSRTWSPKEWKRHNDMMRKIRRHAKATAKAHVREFVESAHTELGVEDDDVDEYETNDAIDDVRESARASAAAVGNGDGGEDDDDNVENILAASQASVLSHSLIVDAVNSTRMFTSKAKRPTTDIAEALAAAVLESEGNSKVLTPSAATSTASASLPPPPPALQLSNSTESTPTEPDVVVVESTPTEGALTIPGITPVPVRAPPPSANIESIDVSSRGSKSKRRDKYGFGDLLVAEDDSVQSLFTTPTPVEAAEVAASSTPRRALR